MSYICTCGNYPHAMGCMCEDDPNELCAADLMDDDKPRLYPWGNYPCSHGDPCLCWDNPPDPTEAEIEAMMLADGYIKSQTCGHFVTMGAEGEESCPVCTHAAELAASIEATKHLFDEYRRLRTERPTDDMDDLYDPFTDL